MPNRFSIQLLSVKLRTKILLIVALTALLPTVLLFVIFYRQTAMMQNREMDNLDHSFEQSVFSLSESVGSVIATAQRLSTHPDVTGFFTAYSGPRESVLDYNTKIRPLLTYIGQAAPPELGEVRFYTDNATLFYSLTVQNVNRSPEDQAFFHEIEALLEVRSPAVRVEPAARTYYQWEYTIPGSLSMFVPIVTGSRNLTFLEVEMSFDRFVQELGVATDSFRSTDYTLVHQSGQVLFSSDEAWFQRNCSGLGDLFQTDGFYNRRIDDEGQVYLVCGQTIPGIDCCLISHSDQSVVLGTVQSFQVLGGLIVVFSVLGSGMLAVRLVKSLLKRTEAINGAIAQMQEGNFDVNIPVYGTDFLEQVAGNLNAMAARIKNLIQNNYEKQLQVKDLQIRMLSQQISPHFLYNTLECLKMRAVLADNMDIARALTSLGRLLRYYADYSSEFAPIQLELGAVQDYVNIMNVVEEKDCVFTYTVEPGLMNRQVPRFVLQPMVENAIKHGCPPGETDIQVELKVEQRDDLMTFILSDNGVGTPPEAAEQIARRLEQGYISSSRRGSVGLYNTNGRIRLLYGEAYGLTFQSEEGKGTRITFAIPLTPPTLPPEDPGPGKDPGS